MTEQRMFTDEELTAYLDGEADYTLVSEIENAWSEAIELQLRDLNAGIAPLRAEAEALLAEAPRSFELPPSTPSRTSNGFWWGAGSGALAASLVAAALWIGVFSQTETAEPWHLKVADYHLLYTKDTLAQDPGPTQKSEELTRLSQTVGLDLTTLPEIADLTYRRAQPLGYWGNPLVQIAFLTSDGIPMALCILRKDGDANVVEAVELRGMAASTWSDNSHRYILIGGQDQSFVDQAALQFSASL